MNKKGFAKYLDFANHHQDATPDEIKVLCQKVRKYGFHSAFVNQCYIGLAKEILGNLAAVGTVVSFPLGQDLRDIKILAAVEASRKGADELDVSLNVGMFLAGKQKEVLEESRAIVESAKSVKPKVLVKFIIETGLLTDDQIKKASQLVLDSGADFVKTCSGLGPRGATVKDVELIKSIVADKIMIKVAGGITNYKQAEAFIKAGAHRIGTSHAVEIIEAA